MNLTHIKKFHRMITHVLFNEMPEDQEGSHEEVLERLPVVRMRREVTPEALVVSWPQQLHTAKETGYH